MARRPDREPQLEPVCFPVCAGYSPFGPDYRFQDSLINDDHADDDVENEQNDLADEQWAILKALI